MIWLRKICSYNKFFVKTDIRTINKRESSEFGIRALGSRCCFSPRSNTAQARSGRPLFSCVSSRKIYNFKSIIRYILFIVTPLLVSILLLIKATLARESVLLGVCLQFPELCQLSWRCGAWQHAGRRCMAACRKALRRSWELCILIHRHRETLALAWAFGTSKLTPVTDFLQGQMNQSFQTVPLTGE